MATAVYYFLGFTAIYIILSWSLFLPYRVGHLYFLNVACMAAAAYFSGVAAVNWGWSVFLVIISGTVLGALIALIISLAIGDSPTFTVVIVGITFIFIVKTWIENTDYLGGTVGFFGIPYYSYFIWLIYGLLAIVGFFIYLLDHSRLGRAASVVFTDRNLARSLGVDIKKLGMLFQTISGALGGLAGVMYAYLSGSLFPDFFSFQLVGTLVCMLFVGGYTTMWGPVLAAFILGGIPVLLPSAVSSWRLLIYGLLLVLFIIIRPEGLITRKMLGRTGTVEFNGTEKE